MRIQLKQFSFSSIAGILLVLTLIVLGVSHVKTEDIKTIKVGIVIPMDHAALRDIVSGFKAVVTENSKNPVIFTVQNAQGDMNLQRSIFQQFINQKMDLIVPVGTQATQMAITLVKKQPIVSLAALFSENDRQKRNPINITGVHDEIEAFKQIKFIRTVFPTVKKITLLHSNSEKVFSEVEDLINSCKTQEIIIQKLMVHNLSELNLVSRLIDKDSQKLVFILKDHLIVSGIKTLIKEVELHKIPIITSDEGSIHEGGTLALGVKERSIGEQGGRLASKVLSGQPISSLPMEEMNELVVFYNPKSCLQNGIDIKSLEEMAKHSDYKAISTE